MSDFLATLLKIGAVLVIFTVVIMNTVYPAIKENGNKLEEKVTGTNYGYFIEEGKLNMFL